MKKLSAVLALAALASVPSVASAQRLGAQVGYGMEVEGLSVGARAEFDLTGVFSKTAPWSNVMFVPAFDFYFPDCGTGVDCSFMELTLPLVVPIKTETLNPYFGAGLSFARTSVEVSGSSASDTETGLAVLGGLKFPLGGMSAFTEARFTLHDADQLTLSFGLLFGGPKN